METWVFSHGYLQQYGFPKMGLFGVLDAGVTRNFRQAKGGFDINRLGSSHY